MNNNLGWLDPNWPCRATAHIKGMPTIKKLESNFGEYDLFVIHAPNAKTADLIKRALLSKIRNSQHTYLEDNLVIINDESRRIVLDDGIYSLICTMHPDSAIRFLRFSYKFNLPYTLHDLKLEQLRNSCETLKTVIHELKRDEGHYI